MLLYKFHYWKHIIPHIYTKILFLTTDFKHLTKVIFKKLVFALQSLGSRARHRLGASACRT